MKKIIILLFALLMLCDYMPIFAINVGTYKTETEFGLLDGFKFNWQHRDKDAPFIDAREESSKKEKAKDLKDYSENEYEYTKYMYDGKVLY